MRRDAGAALGDSRWGHSAADVEAANYGAIHYRLAQGLRREVEKLRAALRRLEELGDFGAANGPLFSPGQGSHTSTPHALAALSNPLSRVAIWNPNARAMLR